MNKYEVELIGVEHEGFEIPANMQRFEVEGYDLTDAAREADMLLYERDISGHLNDYYTDNYNHDETQCELTVGDSERGWSIRYKITELS